MLCCVVGVPGGGSGADGSNGQDGQAGSTATINTVSLLSVPNQNIFMVTPGHANPIILPLFDGSVALKLSSKGGSGGAGECLL